MNQVPLIVVPDREMDRLFGRSVDGFVGMNVLRHFGTVFDFAEHKIGFVFPASLGTADLAAVGMHGAVSVPIEGPRYQPMIGLTINQRPAGTFVIDTGSATSGISRQMATSCGLKDEGEVQRFQAQAGPVDMTTSIADKVSLGSIEIRSLRFTVPKRAGVMVPEARIGRDVLSKFRVLLDVSGRKLYLLARIAR